MDYGATHHLTSDASSIDQLVPYNGPDKVTVDKGSSLSILNHSHNTFTVNSHNLHLSNILHTPNVSNNLLFVHCLYVVGVSVEFNANYFSVKKA